MFGEKFRQVVDAEVERLDAAMAYERERGTEELKRRAWARFGRQKWEWDKTDGLKVGSLLIEMGQDRLGFPVVSWVEHRHLGTKRITCFITRNPDTGELMFCTDGSFEAEAIYSQRPWARLKNFRVSSAQEVYGRSVVQDMVQGYFSQKRPQLASLVMDRSLVVVAEFGDEYATIPMYLNYALATPMEMTALHDALSREFIRKMRETVAARAGGLFLWPRGKEHLAPKLASRQRRDTEHAMNVAALWVVGVTIAAEAVLWLGVITPQTEIGDRLGWSLLTWFGAIAGGVVTGAIGVLVAGR